MSIIKPKLTILPKPQLLLWDDLISTPNDFILYGGTALALRLGHRESIDFDFFSPKAFDPELLYKTVPYLKNSIILQKSQNTLTCSIETHGNVLVSFFGGLNISQVESPSIVESNNLKIASLQDLAGTKTAVIQKRAEKKDYLDIYALLTLGKLSIELLLACASAVYGKEFNPYITLKAMCYFEEPELKSLDSALKQMFLQLAKNANIDLMPKLNVFPLGYITTKPINL
jgi:hypothetical protein